MPLVDVLLPVHAIGARLASRAIDSILTQTFGDLRLIVIDDGALEDARAWLDTMSRDPRLTVVTTRRPGIVGALETGLRCSDAPLVARMDADDLALPWRLEAQVALLRDKPDLDLVAAPVLLEGDAAAGWIRHVTWSNRIMQPDDHFAERFVDAPVVHPTVMMRREVLERWGGYVEGPFADDYELWLRALHAGGRFGKIAGPGLVWNRTPSTLTASHHRFSASMILKLRAAWLARHLSERSKRFAVWGAGPSGRRIARELESEGLVAEGFYDIDPRKIGRLVRGHRVQPADVIEATRPWLSGIVLLAAVASPGARYLIAQRLAAWGAKPGVDWLPVA